MINKDIVCLEKRTLLEVLVRLENGLFEVFKYDSNGNAIRPYARLHGKYLLMSDQAIDICLYQGLSKKDMAHRLWILRLENIKTGHECEMVVPALFYEFEENGKYGVRKRNGDIFIPPVCQQVYINPYWIKTKQKGTYQLYDIEKQQIIVPYGVYQYIDYFYRNLARARSVEGGWGIIDTHGHIIVPFEYNEVYQFVNRSDLKKTKLIKNHQTFYVSFDEMHRVSEAGGWDKTTCCILPERKTHHQDEEDDSWRDDAELDTWYALTDGEYGDMPEAFDGDYSFMGL